MPMPMPVEERYRPARIAHPHQQSLGRIAPFHEHLDLPAARVHERVAGNLGHRGGDAGLALAVEAQAGGQIARALAHRHHVLLVADEEGRERHARGHGARSRAAKTVTSSRPRHQSR
jgi:hypothetical protein